MPEQQPLQCCVTQCDRQLDQTYWNTQYDQQTTGWDIGYASGPLVHIINQLSDKNCRILIPGAGNAYEADYLLENGFTDITIVDIAPIVVTNLQKKYAQHPQIKVICQDFFILNDTFDVILEQTFFCALVPQWRPRYVFQMHRLLRKDGLLTGVLFNRMFEQGPPFGGHTEAYVDLFGGAFTMQYIEPCTYSIAPRAGAEVLFACTKNDDVVNLYAFDGITCSGCSADVCQLLSSIPDVIQAHISVDFKELLIVSRVMIPIEVLQHKLSAEPKYQLRLLRLC